MRYGYLFSTIFFMLLTLLGCGNDANNQSTTVAKSEEIAVGEKQYVRYCFGCHASGASGAPKVGDTVQWEKRLSKGYDAVFQNLVEGLPPRMPAKGFCSTCTNEELHQIMHYILSESNIPISIIHQVDESELRRVDK